MVILQAPHELIQTTIFLPNPLFGDEENIKDQTTIRRSMNGSIVTYNRRNLGRGISLDFELDRMKLLELSEFVFSYISYNMRLTDHRGRIWRVVLLNSPTDFINSSRGRGQVKLNFEGEII